MGEPYTVLEGDCLQTLKALPKCCVDAVVCDPPYGLGFQGAGWDHEVPGPAYWRRAWHRLKPGGHLVAFGGSRTFVDMFLAIREAGFELRDTLMWMTSKGMPKSLDVSKAIDRAAGAERKVIGHKQVSSGTGKDFAKMSGQRDGSAATTVAITAPATEAAQQWEGWGTGLKPAWEPICLARKPLSEKTVQANVQRWGTGALNIDGTRIRLASGGESGPMIDGKGRWPANVILDPEAAAVLDEQSGQLTSGKGVCVRRKKSTFVANVGIGHPGDVQTTYGDTGGASRFFYCAKATKRDRRGSRHPTVKPIKLMRWLCRLVTPPGGTVLDLFAGSGTTGEAALLEGLVPILCEREAEFAADCRRRLAEVVAELSVEK